MVGSLILDAGGILKLAASDARAWTRMVALQELGWRVVIPTPVIAQVHRGGVRGGGVERVLAAVGLSIPTTEAVAGLAGQLLGITGRSDAIDAIVVAEALAMQPSAILTTDPADLTALLDAQADRARVMILGV